MVDKLRRNKPLVLPLSHGSLVTLGRRQFAVLAVAFELLLQLGVVGLFFLVLAFDPLALLLAGIPQNFVGSFTLFASAFLPPLLFKCSALLDLLFDADVCFLAAVLDRLASLHFLVLKHLFLHLNFLLQFLFVLLHPLLELNLVELFRHFAVEHELLVQWVAQGDIWLHERLRRCGAVVHHEVHGVLAERHSTWTAVVRPIHVQGPTQAAKGPVHRRWLFHLERELVFDLFDDALANVLLNLLSVQSAFVFVVLQTHLSNFVRHTLLLEVLQGPTDKCDDDETVQLSLLGNKLLVWDVQELARKLRVLVQRAITIEQEPTLQPTDIPSD